MHPHLSEFLAKGDKDYLMELAESLNARVEWETSDLLHLNDYAFYSSINNKPIEL